MGTVGEGPAANRPAAAQALRLCTPSRKSAGQRRAAWAGQLTAANPTARQQTRPRCSKGSSKVSLVGVAQTGDKRATLEALRDLLATAIDDTDSGRDLAALALRFTDVLNEIDKLPTSKDVTAADEIAQRRAARRRASAARKARAQQPAQ